MTEIIIALVPNAWNIATGIMTIIGGATVLFRVFAPLTENKTDDKILGFLNRALEIISLNRREGQGILEIKIKS